MVANALQCAAGVALAFVVELLPAVEAARQARGNLRVAVVQVEDAVGEEGITLGGMEADQVGSETAQQGVDLVRVGNVEGRTPWPRSRR